MRSFLVNVESNTSDPDHRTRLLSRASRGGFVNSSFTPVWTTLLTLLTEREALDSVSLIVKAFVEHSDRMSPCEMVGPEYRQGERGLLGYESVRLESGNI